MRERLLYKGFKPGGALIFDVSSEYKIKNILANNVFAEDLDDLTLLWFNELTGNKLTMSLTFFIKDGEKYVRKEETHVQYAHSVEFIQNALKEFNSGRNFREDGKRRKRKRRENQLRCDKRINETWEKFTKH